MNSKLIAHYATCVRPYFDLIYKDGNTPDVAFCKLEENINEGKAVYAAEGPDYETMKDLVQESDHDYERKAFMDAINNDSDYIDDLYALYNAEKYDELVIASISAMAEELLTMSPDEKERYERLKKEAEEFASSMQHE